MQDTPKHIKQLQLKIWLAKPPAEHLLRMLDDEALFEFWEAAKQTKKKG